MDVPLEMGMRRARWPYLALTGLALLFFAPQVVHPQQVLYGPYSDFWALHLPMKHYLARQWRETGELPLWCPSRYAGTPFVHDIQVGAFYPLHFPLMIMSDAWLGPALSWLIVLHVVIAGWGMFAYARWRELNDAGALAAAIGYMFAGRWLLHVLAGGHYITIGLAWLPVVLLFLEKALRQASLLQTTWAGCVFALIVLSTHPQWTFYAGWFIALWTLGPALERAGYLEGSGETSPTRTRNALALWLVLGLWTALVATALSAVQLGPTLEASRFSSRAGGVSPQGILSAGRLTLHSLVGPALTAQPPQLAWEERGGFGLLWLTASLLAPFLCRRAGSYFQAGVCLLLFFFALGGATLWQGLPGFGLFRQPSRILIIAAFPMAFLAGASVSALTEMPRPANIRRLCRFLLIVTTFANAVLVGSLALQWHRADQPLQGHVYWLSLLLTLPAMYWLLGDASANRPRLLRGAWLLLLLVDAWALTWPLVAVRPEADVFAPSASVRFLDEQPRDPQRILDNSPADSTTFPLGTGAPLALLHDLQALRGYTPLDVLRYKEYLQFLGDSDEALHALGHDLTYPVIPNFPIRNKSLLDLLGTRYLVQPSAAELPGTPAEWHALFTDPDPAAYDCVAGGRRRLGVPCTVYENRTALPRAFVVSEWAALSAADPLTSLKENDFRRRVLLEKTPPTLAPPPPGQATYRPARIRDYRPNRVTIDVTRAAPGYLVLTDIWFPGWRCAVDGQPVEEIYRANYLFRGVPLPEGAQEVVFTFAPRSYEKGLWLSGGAVVFVALLSLGACCRPIMGLGLARPAK